MRTAEHWSKTLFKDFLEANALSKNFKEEKDKNLDAQLERYEAAVSGYVPEPTPEPEIIKMKLLKVLHD